MANGTDPSARLGCLPALRPWWGRIHFVLPKGRLRARVFRRTSFALRRAVVLRGSTRLEILHLGVRSISAASVAQLDRVDQFRTILTDDIEIVLGQLAPALLDT